MGVSAILTCHLGGSSDPMILSGLIVVGLGAASMKTRAHLLT